MQNNQQYTRGCGLLVFSLGILVGCYVVGLEFGKVTGFTALAVYLFIIGTTALLTKHK